MSFSKIMQAYQFLWLLESHAQQRLSWDDAAQARLARTRAEAQAAAQWQAMRNANPGGALGDARLNDPDTLDHSGLL